LTNGNYVVRVPDWDNGSLRDVGAIVLGSGTTGLHGTITPANALIGEHADDRIGDGGSSGDPGIVVFSNDDFVIGSPHWHRNGAAAVGAATYLSGKMPFSGTITTDNSMLGISANDLVGARIKPLPNDRYAVFAPKMDAPLPAGVVVDAGAVVPGGTHGDITLANAVFGKRPQSGANTVMHANADVLAIGRPTDNEVSIVRWGPPISDRIFGNAFEAAEMPRDDRPLSSASDGEARPAASF